MVPPNGATDQSPATVVVLQATGAQLERVEVRALAFRSSLPGRFEEARHEWRRSRGLQSGTTYAVGYTVKAHTGLVATGSGTFTTAPPGAAFVRRAVIEPRWFVTGLAPVADHQLGAGQSGRLLTRLEPIDLGAGQWRRGQPRRHLPGRQFARWKLPRCQLAGSQFRGSHLPGRQLARSSARPDSSSPGTSAPGTGSPGSPGGTSPGSSSPGGGPREGARGPRPPAAPRPVIWPAPLPAAAPRARVPVRPSSNPGGQFTWRQLTGASSPGASSPGAERAQLTGRRQPGGSSPGQSRGRLRLGAMRRRASGGASPGTSSPSATGLGGTSPGETQPKLVGRQFPRQRWPQRKPGRNPLWRVTSSTTTPPDDRVTTTRQHEARDRFAGWHIAG